MMHSALFALVTALFLNSAQASFWDAFRSKKPSPPASTESITLTEGEIVVTSGHFRHLVPLKIARSLLVKHEMGEVRVIPGKGPNVVLSGIYKGKNSARLSIQTLDHDVLGIRVKLPEEQGPASIPEVRGKNISITVNGGKSVILVDGTLIGGGDLNSRLDLQIEVPDGMLRDLAIEAHRVSVSDWNDGRARSMELHYGSELLLDTVDAKNGVSLETSSGDAEVRHVTGDVQARSGSGTIKLIDVRGEAEVKAVSGDVSLSRVGAAWIATESGDVSLRQIRGDLTVNTRSGDVKLTTVHGHAEIRTVSGEVIAREMGGDVDVSTSSGDVELQSTRRNARVQTSSGDIMVEDAHGHVSVKTSSGSISSRTRSDAGHVSLQKPQHSIQCKGGLLNHSSARFGEEP